MGATPAVLPTGGGGVGGGGGGEPAVAAVAAMVGVSALVTAAERGDRVTLVAGMACLDLPCWGPPHLDLWGADGPGWLALGCVIMLACP